MTGDRRVGFSVSIPEGLLDKVEGARGKVPRSRWVEEAIEGKLRVDGGTS